MSEFKTVTAIYENKDQAKNAMIYLRSQGVNQSDISLLGSENSIAEDMDMNFDSEQSVAQKGANGVAVGAAVGASALGLTTFTAATLTGGAALLGAGPMIAALAGATAGATAGGLLGGFVGVGVPEIEARLIEEKLSNGHIVIGVQTDSEKSERVKKLLTKTEGERVVIH